MLRLMNVCSAKDKAERRFMCSSSSFVNHFIVRIKSALTTASGVGDFSFRAALNRLSPAENQ